MGTWDTIGAQWQEKSLYLMDAVASRCNEDGFRAFRQQLFDGEAVHVKDLLK